MGNINFKEVNDLAKTNKDAYKEMLRRIKLAQNGDEQQTLDILNACEKIIFASAHKYLKSVNELIKFEDLVDSATFAVLEAIRDFKEDSGMVFTSYAFMRIKGRIKHDFYSEMTKNNIKVFSLNETLEDNELDELVDCIEDEKADVLKKVMLTDKSEKIYKALENLKPQHKEILILKYIEGLSQKEIADKLGLTVSVVNRRCEYARKLIAKQVKRL